MARRTFIATKAGLAAASDAPWPAPTGESHVLEKPSAAHRLFGFLARRR